MTFLVFSSRQTTREADLSWVTGLAEPIDMRTTRVRQPQQAPHLIEGLPGGVVESATQLTHIGSNIVNSQNV